jgi:hypothetical protein
MGFDFGIGEAALASTLLTAGEAGTTAAGTIGATALTAGEAAAAATGTGLTLAAPAAAGAGAGAVSTGLTAASLAGTAASTAVGVMGQRQTAAANAANARYQAAVAANNQLIAQQNARYATQAGAVNAQAMDFRTRALMGSEIAAQGASGIDIGSGSPLDVVRSTAGLGRLDTANIIQGANLQAYGYQTAATGFGAEAGLQQQQARYAGTAGMIGGAGTILGGATSLASKWLQYQNVGLLPGGPGSPGAGGI